MLLQVCIEREGGEVGAWLGDLEDALYWKGGFVIIDGQVLGVGGKLLGDPGVPKDGVGAWGGGMWQCGGQVGCREPCEAGLKAVNGVHEE